MSDFRSTTRLSSQFRYTLKASRSLNWYKPNAITLSDSSQLRTSSEPASVMEFGFIGVHLNTCLIEQLHCRLKSLKLEAKDVRCFTKHKPHAGHQKRRKCRFCLWWSWSLTFDRDLQTRPSVGPNTSSVWIWRKSVQSRDISCTNKKHTDGAKNRTFRSSLRAVITYLLISGLFR